jgi:hypothetical protein
VYSWKEFSQFAARSLDSTCMCIKNEDRIQEDILMVEMEAVEHAHLDFLSLELELDGVIGMG